MEMSLVKTRWTSWLVVRCNKLTSELVEEAVKVVRNHEGGTCGAIGIVLPKRVACITWEWTPACMSTERRSLKNPVEGA